MPIYFINQKNQNERSEIRMERNCVIQNIDQKKGNRPSNELSFALSNGQTREVWLPQTQYKLLQALASANDCDADDDIDVLTIRDLMRAKERFQTSTDVFRDLGVTEFRCDLKAGVVNITTNKGEVLRVDIETKGESNQKRKTTSDTTPNPVVQQKPIPKPDAKIKKAESHKSSTVKKDNKTASAKKSQAAVPKHDVVKPNANVASIISKFKGGNISIYQVHDMKSVARYTGISERYIRDILVGIEGKNNWPLTKAEYDGVADKKHPKGYLTIGFGHTSLTGEPIVYEGMVISSKQAYQILANDIMTAKKYAKYYGGDAYNNAPNSIKNAMIDLVFNKGPGAINENLKANLNKGYFHSAALRTWYITNNVGLQKRNIYRFIEACKNLTTNERRNAISRFRNEHLLAMQNVFKKDNNSLVEWNSFCIVSKCKEYRF